MIPQIIPYRAEHLLVFQNRDTQRKEELLLAVNKEKWGPAYTAVAGDEILGCAGVAILWTGVGAAWVNISESMGAYKIWFHRTVSRMLADVIRGYDLHRVEAVALADNERNQKWFKSLGFRPEGGKAIAYTSDKQDIIRFERVRL